jgi:hypothetical protein
MATLFWFALVVGAGLLLFSLFADADGGADGGDLAVDAGGAPGAHGFELLSIRTATYFLFGFGATGVLLGLTGTGAVIRTLMAILVGALAGGISAAAFGWLGRTQSGDLLDDDTLVGLVGQVTVPLSRTGTGKVEVVRGHRELELLARPFDRNPDAPETWSSVVIVDFEGGVARVSRYTESLGSGEPPPALPNPPEE